MATEIDTRKSYFNTLVFTIVAGVISLCLLVVMFFPFGKQWMPFLITTEVGIFIIIIVCIFQIIGNEKLNDKYRNQKNFMIDFTTCPDYYVQRNISGKTICSNEYIVEDEFQNKFIMKILPADNPSKNLSVPFPPIHTPAYIDSMLPTEKYPNTKLDSIPELKTTSEKCSAVLGLNQSQREFGYIPVTGIRARCESFA